MAQRFKTPPVPTGEVSSYISDPYNLSAIYMMGSSSPFTGAGNTIVRPSDDLLISKGGNRALSVYQRLLFDEHVQSSFAKLVQEVTARPWYVEEYSQKPGDLAVRDYVAEVLEELAIDELYKGMCEALIVGYSVGEVMWKKTKRGVIPFDIRMRDQRRFVFQENEDAQTGFTMRCLTFNRMFEGIELPARKFIVNRHWAFHNGDPYGSGLGRVLYPLVKFRRRAIESYVLYGDRFATPTVVATSPLSASTAEIDTIYNHISNLSQETALVLPEGFKLDFINPSGNPDVFKSLVDYIDKEISLLICGENEAGQAESGSRASSQVANVVRVVKAAEISEIVSQVLTRTLIRWIVDLNFGVDVASPTIKREFRIEESSLTVADVSMLMQSGFKPKKEWVERHFRVDLEEEPPSYTPGGKQDDDSPVKYDAEKDKDLYESIFGPEEPVAETPEATAETPAEAPVEETPETPVEAAPEATAETPAEETPETAPEEVPTEEAAPVATPEETPSLEPEVPAEETPETTPEATTEETPSPEPEVPAEETPDENLLAEAENLTGEEPNTPAEETPEATTEGAPSSKNEDLLREANTMLDELPPEETPETTPEATTEETPPESDEDLLNEASSMLEEETPKGKSKAEPASKKPKKKGKKKAKTPAPVEEEPRRSIPTDAEIDDLINSVP
jgi:hypothetical protein